MRARPWVSVNFAISWDGRIAASPEGRADFTSPRDKRRLLEIRARADAVLVSARTATADGMSLGLPSAALRRQRQARGQAMYPLRVLLSNSGKIPAALPLFEKPLGSIHIFSTVRMPARTRARLAGQAELHLARGPAVNLRAMLETLRRQYGVERLHCEGGGGVFRSLLAAKLVDEIFLTVAPRIFGGLEAPTLTGKLSRDFLPRSVRADLVEARRSGEEMFLRYEVRQGPR